MFRLFENLVDPYQAHAETDTPPRRLWPFIRAYSQPFRRVFAFAAISSVIVAAVEIGLIWYMGRLVDVLSTDTSANVWADNVLCWEILAA